LKVPDTKKSLFELTSGDPEAEDMPRKLSNFIVTNVYTNATPEMVSLAIDIQRQSGPFWRSLFIPSICLILAAEIALFVDESHFEAMIMVLTSNLVMYTLYSAILEKMPEDSTLRLIDIWLLHGLLMPMVVFVVLATNELLNNRYKTNTISRTTTKETNPTVKVAFKSQNGTEDEDSSIQKSRKYLNLCKVLIPTTSILFIIIFFVICLMQ